MEILNHIMMNLINHLLTKKLESASINNLLLKNTFEVTVPGTGFLIGKATVGDTVNLKIVNSNLDNN